MFAFERRKKMEISKVAITILLFFAIIGINEIGQAIRKYINSHKTHKAKGGKDEKKEI